MKERKDLLDDAKAATAAALAEGIVPGGGVALLRCEKALKKITDLVGDEEAGVRIIQKFWNTHFAASPKTRASMVASLSTEFAVYLKPKASTPTKANTLTCWPRVLLTQPKLSKRL